MLERPPAPVSLTGAHITAQSDPRPRPPCLAPSAAVRLGVCPSSRSSTVCADPAPSLCTLRRLGPCDSGRAALPGRGGGWGWGGAFQEMINNQPVSTASWRPSQSHAVLYQLSRSEPHSQPDHPTTRQPGAAPCAQRGSPLLSFDTPCFSGNLPISSNLSKVLAQNCSRYSLIILTSVGS